MPRRWIMRATALRRAGRLLPAGLLLLLPVCRPGPQAEPAPSPVPQPEEHVVRQDPAEAARLAREIRDAASVEIADGLALTLWASDSLVADPVALAVDDRGRVYYTRTIRAGRSEFDIRGHRDWMVESITFDSVEDRRRFLRRELAPERSERNRWLEDMNGDGSHDWRDLTVIQEHVYRLDDASGDGIADRARRVIADFDTEVTDIAGGLLVHDRDVFVGVAPDLWRLRDTTGDGVPDSRESISHGYGVHIGFGGHGVSGVTMGPDGRIYWAIGDVGLNVTDREGRQWSYPNQGAILRAEPDGSGFEVFAAGLRNTHEFAFDEHGNLISVDNDGDHPGETERVVYLVNGSDSGWRTNWQFGKYVDPANNAYKVWMDEELFRPRFEGQAAYILPPIASYHAGPSGMIYNPGTALSERWRGHFFISEFTGSPATSNIHAFRLEPRGAGFELARDTVVLKGILTTGIEVGPDGALYLGDWIEGWEPKGAGRIWKLDAPGSATWALRSETRALLAQDFRRRSDRDLLGLLRHADMRVRQKAQFALADRGAARTLLAAARQREHRLARLHGLWGMGQLARKDPRHARILMDFLEDADAEVRAQAAKVIGDVRYAAAGSALVALLRDPEARPRFFAAEALGRIEHRPAVQPLIQMLAADGGEDAYLRHGGALALARIGQPDPVVALADHPSRALRVAAVVALRRMGHPGVARFLDDPDEYVVTEAARAINDDQSIEAAVPDLARVLEERRFSGEALLRRAINANLRAGTPEAARRLAEYAARSGAPEAMRVEAVAALGVLPEPSILDRVDGSPRGELRRDPAVARAALAPLLAPGREHASARLRVALAEAAGRVRLPQATPTLLAWVRTDPEAEVRVAALRALHATGDTPMEAAVRAALADHEPSVRMAALALIPTLGLPEATTAELLASSVRRGSVEERQSALRALGQLRGPEAHRVLGVLLDRLVADRLPAAIQLDLLEAVEASGSPALIARLEQHRAARAGAAPVVAFADALHGGDPGRGRRIVFENPSAQCTRCHAFGGEGPAVGPDLRAIGSVLSREQLLAALVDPGARIAPGFGQPGGPSAMPPMGHLLSRREIRDVVAYLATLRGDGGGGR